MKTSLYGRRCWSNQWGNEAWECPVILDSFIRLLLKPLSHRLAPEELRTGNETWLDGSPISTLSFCCMFKKNKNKVLCWVVSAHQGLHAPSSNMLLSCWTLVIQRCEVGTETDERKSWETFSLIDSSWGSMPEINLSFHYIPFVEKKQQAKNLLFSKIPSLVLQLVAPLLLIL